MMSVEVGWCRHSKKPRLHINTRQEKQQNSVSTLLKLTRNCSSISNFIIACTPEFQGSLELAQESCRVTSQQHIALMAVVTLAVHVQVRWRNMSMR